jgi:hypothetical protein
VQTDHQNYQVGPDSEGNRVVADPMPLDYTHYAAQPKIRVRWGRATALQLVAGAVAGFFAPLLLFSVGPADWNAWDLTDRVGVVAFLIITSFITLLFGAGLPLLVAWLTWLIVSRRQVRRQRNEVLAVVFGAIGGSVIACAIPILLLVGNGAGIFFFIPVLAIGGIPALAFALWVAGGWRRMRKATVMSRDSDD